MFIPIDLALPLCIGVRYRVCAVSNRSGSLFYYICDEDFAIHGYPVPYPVELFGPRQPATPATWKRYPNEDGFLESGLTAWKSDLFYERLIDRDDDAVAQFRSYMERLDNEPT